MPWRKVPLCFAIYTSQVLVSIPFLMELIAGEENYCRKWSISRYPSGRKTPEAFAAASV